MPYTTPAYEFLVRNPRSLAVVGELRPQDIAITWTRRSIEPGSFQLTIAREFADLDVIALHNLIEVRRDALNGSGPQTEFVGIIESRDMDEFGRMWTLDGVDLLGFWLTKRLVAVTAAAAKSGPAETVLKQYVAENIGASAATARQARGELSAGVAWDVEADQARGDEVHFRALRANLLTEVLVPICRMGDLLQSLVLKVDYTGYEYRVARPVDRTASAGSAPFSLGWDNVEELGYREDYRPSANAFYVLGDGTGDTRNVTEVLKNDSVASHFRREGALDARFAVTVDQRTDIGTMEGTRQEEAARVVRGKPFRVSENARYRLDWDVGADVTVALPQIEVTVDRRIVSATVALVRGTGEEIAFELGASRGESVLQRMVEKLRQLNAAANA